MILSNERSDNLEQDRFVEFSTLLNEVQKSITRIKCKKMDTYGLGSSHTLCICILQQHPQGITKTALAKRCAIDKAQVSRVIDELLKKNYVTALPAKKNYNQKYLLTEEGTEVADNMRNVILEINTFVSDSIPEDQIENFYSTFKTICNNLNKAEDIF